MSLKKNVIANYLGQGWVALMGLAFVPLYIKYLGMEAYGLIGLFAVLQAWLTLLDMGMTQTLSREMSRFTGGAHTAQSINDLLRSLELVCIGVAIMIALGIWAASRWLASDWLHVEELPVATVAQAFAIMGVVTALRFVEDIYRGAIVGLQRQVLLNAVNALLATVRGLGAVGLLACVSPTIGVFFLWQGVLSLLTVAIFAVVVYRTLPPATLKPRFSRSSLDAVWRFAGGMMATTFLALLLTQVDKVILSRLLSLEAFGRYCLASVVAGSLFILVGPVTQAYYPHMTELVTRCDEVSLVTIYHRGAQIISVLVGSAAIMLIFFGERLVALWTGNPSLAHEVAPLVVLLATGTLLNSLMHIPYMLQLAYGWSSFAAKINMVAVALLVPAIFWATPRYGAIGAASVWVVLNSGYVLISIFFMHRRLIPHEKWRWYCMDLGLPLAAITITAGVFRFLQPMVPLSKILELCWLVAVGFIVTCAGAFSSAELRFFILRQLKKKESNNV
ncbi:MAG: lipopolysaccharide biosynthesis protein [Geobacteraceae bacterium]